MENEKHDPKDNMRRKWRRWSKRTTEEIGRPLSVSDTFSGLMDIRRLVGAAPQELYDTGSGVITLSGRLPPAPAVVPPLQLYRQPQERSEWKIGLAAVALAALVVISLAIAVLVRVSERSAPPPEPVVTPAVALVARDALPKGDRSTVPFVEPAIESSPEPAAAAPPTAREEKRPAAVPRADKDTDKQDRDLERLLSGKRSRHDRRRSRAAGAEPAVAPIGDRPRTLNRAQVKAGMSSVAAKVKRCGAGKSGLLVMDVVIGKNGRVIRAHATGSLAGTKAGKCAAAAVRQAGFPQFDGPRIGVKYPFML